jgi:N6-adenosine-specific RNA methylase IME4
MSEKIHKVVSLNPSGITILPDRMRALREEVVAGLAESISIGQKQFQPIIVRPRPRGGMGYILVAGWHRLMAIRALKRDSIDAYVYDINADEAKLIEIDENLIRADLTLAERAASTAARKPLYLKLYPQTRQGRAPGKKSGKGGKTKKPESGSLPFAKDTAKKTGRSHTQVKADVHRGEKIVVLTEIAGTCLDKEEELDALAKLSHDEQRILAKLAQAYAKDKTEKKPSAKTRVKQINRDNREQQLGMKLLALPTKKYGVLVEDYEWDFKVWSEEGMDRHAANHYPVSKDAHTAEEIVARTKERFECAADNCALFKWTTVPHLAIAIDVMRLHGFRYVSNWAWDKIDIGTGHWNRNRHEILLLGIKGEIPCPAPGQQWESLLSIKATEHSAKPEKFLEMIEAYFPNLPKNELNRRGQPRPGWDAWGLEAEPAEAAE